MRYLLMALVTLLIGCSKDPIVFDGGCKVVDKRAVMMSVKDIDVSNYVIEKGIYFFQVDSLGDTLKTIQTTYFHINYTATLDSIVLQTNDVIDKSLNSFRAIGN